DPLRHSHPLGRHRGVHTLPCRTDHGRAPGSPGLFLGWAVQLQSERLKGQKRKRLRLGGVSLRAPFSPRGRPSRVQTELLGRSRDFTPACAGANWCYREEAPKVASAGESAVLRRAKDLQRQPNARAGARFGVSSYGLEKLGVTGSSPVPPSEERPANAGLLVS